MYLAQTRKSNLYGLVLKVPDPNNQGTEKRYYLNCIAGKITTKEGRGLPCSNDFIFTELKKMNIN